MMAVVRRKRSAEFAIIPNDIAANNVLSFEARGLLVYLLSKPNDWKVLVKDIQSEGGVGRDKAYRLLNELIDASYVEKKEVRGPGSRYTDVEYVVHDCILPNVVYRDVRSNKEPEEECFDRTDSGFSGSGKPDSGKSGHNTKKGRIQRTESPLPPKNGGEEMWDQFLGLWPKQHLPRNLRAAKADFQKLSDTERKAAHETCRFFLLRKLVGGETPLLIPYLKSKAWQEFLGEPPKGADGYFVIERFRPEWEAWVEHIQETKSEEEVGRVKRQGQILAKRRWPT